MSITPRFLGVALALSAAVAPTVADATTYAQHMSVDALLDRSDKVVRGTVAATEARYTDQGFIETLVTVRVDDVVAGTAGDTITVVAPGGTVEGKTLTITGAAEFRVGDAVVVFADGKKIVGFGQGAFAVGADNVARRSMGNAVPDHPIELDMGRAFGQPDRAQTCIDQHIDQTQAEGWQLRGATGTRLGRDDVAMWRVNLLGGMEYRLEACADGLYDGARLMIADADGQAISWADAGQEASLTFQPVDSGVYFVGLYAEDLPEGVWRGAATMSIHYR